MLGKVIWILCMIIELLLYVHQMGLFVQVGKVHTSVQVSELPQNVWRVIHTRMGIIALLPVCR